MKDLQTYVPTFTRFELIIFLKEELRFVHLYSLAFLRCGWQNFKITMIKVGIRQCKKTVFIFKDSTQKKLFFFCSQYYTYNPVQILVTRFRNVPAWL
jgi:hypothetical protein